MPTIEQRHTKCCELWKKRKNIGKVKSKLFTIWHQQGSFPLAIFTKTNEARVQSRLSFSGAHNNLWPSRVEARFTFHENNLSSKANVKNCFLRCCSRSTRSSELKSSLDSSDLCFGANQLQFFSQLWWVFNWNDWVGIFRATKLLPPQVASNCLISLELFAYVRASHLNRIYFLYVAQRFSKQRGFCAQASEWPRQKVISRVKTYMLLIDHLIAVLFK